MDILKPWLAATIEGELDEALRFQDDGTKRQESIERPQGQSYDDGSNLRILSANKGRVVQITKFLTFEEPIQVTLSDSVIRVNASIANQASQQYARENRRKVTEGTLGGLIQLQDFEIVATHLGPRDKRLTLYVKDFKSIGANGSGSFGIAPQAIESRERTKDLLNKLALLRRRKPNTPFNQSSKMSPVATQPSNYSSATGDDPQSQVGFATQVPRSNAHIASKLKSPDLIAGVSIGSTCAANSETSTPLPMKGKAVNTSNELLRNDEVQRAPQKISTGDTRQALLSLLKNRETGPPKPELLSEPKTKHSPTHTSMVHQTENGALPDLSLAPDDDGASRNSIGIHKRKRHSPDSTPAKKAPNDYTLHGIGEARKGASEDPDLRMIETNRESLAVNYDLGDSTRSERVVADTSTETRRSRPTSPSISGIAKSGPGLPLGPTALPFTKLTSSAISQQGGRTRITSRDVNISKDQESLLSRADSWVPAEPGQREPTANVPISLLKTLNRRASLRAQRSEKTRNQTNGTGTPGVVVESTTDSDSDVPVSSGRWPASPERDELPPDSSPASAGELNHSVSGAPRNSRLLSSSRRQSDASFSSNLMQSARPSPNSFSIGSGSPGTGIPVINATSNSAAEAVHQFKCQAPGCSESYKGSGGLKSHLDRVHPSTGSFENYKCPGEDCTNSYASPESLDYHLEQQHRNVNAAPPGRSPSVTPSLPGPSTPIFTGIKVWSENDERLEEKSVENGANNELENEEAASSLLPLLYPDPGDSKEEVTARRSLSVTSQQKSNLPSDAQPAPAQSLSKPPDETQAANERFSTLLPASPTPESDIEMTVPHALIDNTDSVASNTPMQRIPSTASQPQDPYTQVKRTPYVNGRVQIEAPPELGFRFSPMKGSLYPQANGTIHDDVEIVSASVASGLETSTAETHGENASSNPLWEQDSGDVAAKLSEESNSRSMTNSILERSYKTIPDGQEGFMIVEAETTKADDPSSAMTEAQSRDSELKNLSVIAGPSGHFETIPEALPALEDKRASPQLQLTTSDHAGNVASEMKRKVQDSGFASPNMVKRQKRFKIPSAFTFTERSDSARDPSEGARQYRQDFFASRRSSENSTPTKSPKVPFTNFPGTSPETSRDPSERARQFRLEFLASRKKSETSTPLMSPRTEFTAHMEATQVERGKIEEEGNFVGAVLQDRSVDSENERQKIPELEPSLPSSQPQGKEIRIVSPANGAASIQSDGDDTRNGAQEFSDPDHEADFPMFATQSADSKSYSVPHGNATEASSRNSNGEEHGAQSVELNGSLQFLDTQETESDFVKANEGERIVDAGGDTANKYQEDLFANTEPVEGHIDMSIRADKVAEQKNNMPTLEVMHTMNSESAILDNDAPEPTPAPHLFGIDSVTPLPDVQIDQDRPSTEPSGYIDKPVNRALPPSLSAPALVAKCNTGDWPLGSAAAAKSSLAPSTPVSEFGPKSGDEHQNTMQLPTETIQVDSPLVPRTIFDKFKEAYPAYPGDMKHFVAICRKINQLVKAGRMMHESLWDDFIFRHKVEYSQYLRRCAEEAEDAIPYEKFYQTEIEGPRYQMRVIHQQNLDEVLLLNAQKPGLEAVENDCASKPDALIENTHLEHAPAKANEVDQAGIQSVPKTADLDQSIRKLPGSRVTIDLGAERVRGKTIRGQLKGEKVFEEGKSTQAVQRPSEKRVTIDLTQDDLLEDQPKRTKDRQTKAQSKNSRLVNGVSLEPPPPQNRRDSSTSEYQVPLPSQERLPGFQARAPTNSTIETKRRSLPWKKADCGTLQSSSTANVDDTLKRFKVLKPRATRAENSNSAGLQLSARSPPYGSEQRQDPVESCQRIIQSNWGIGAHGLLEPGYYGGQLLSESMIELVAEISKTVDVHEARNRVKEAIEIRLKGNAQRGVSLSSQDRKVLKSDLEVVRGIVETSSMSTTSPFSLPHTNAAAAKRYDGRPYDWWDDDNSPFKSFVRAYTSIRPGKGNSYAKAKSTKPRHAEKVPKDPISGVQLRKIDFMSWDL